MRLVHNQLETQFIFDSETTHTLVVESPIVMRMIISDLKNQIHGDSGGFVLSEHNLKELAIPKIAELIMDPFISAEHSKLFTTKLLQAMKGIASSEEHFELTAKIESDLLKYASILIQSVDESLTFCDRIEIGTLLKMFGFTLDFEYDNPVENLITYIKGLNTHLGKKLFFMVNAKGFFSADELTHMVSTTHGMKCDILFIENSHREPFIIKEKCSIIDADFCEIYSEGV